MTFLDKAGGSSNENHSSYPSQSKSDEWDNLGKEVNLDVDIVDPEDKDEIPF